MADWIAYNCQYFRLSFHETPMNLTAFLSVRVLKSSSDYREMIFSKLEFCPRTWNIGQMVPKGSWQSNNDPIMINLFSTQLWHKHLKQKLLFKILLKSSNMFTLDINISLECWYDCPVSSNWRLNNNWKSINRFKSSTFTSLRVSAKNKFKCGSSQNM